MVIVYCTMNALKVKRWSRIKMTTRAQFCILRYVVKCSGYMVQLCFPLFTMHAEQANGNTRLFSVP